MADSPNGPRNYFLARRRRGRSSDPTSRGIRNSRRPRRGVRAIVHPLPRPVPPRRTTRRCSSSCPLE